MLRIQAGAGVRVSDSLANEPNEAETGWYSLAIFGETVTFCLPVYVQIIPASLKYELFQSHNSFRTLGSDFTLSRYK